MQAQYDRITLRTFLVLLVFNAGLLAAAVWIERHAGTAAGVAFIAGVFVVQLLTSSFANGTQHALTHNPLFGSYPFGQVLSLVNSVVNSKNPPFLWNVHHSLMHHLANNGPGDASRVWREDGRRRPLGPYIVAFVLDAVPIFVRVIRRFRRDPALARSRFLDPRDLKYLWLMPALLVPYVAGIAWLAWWSPLAGATYLAGMLANMIEVAGLNYVQHAWDANPPQERRGEYTTVRRIMRSAVITVGPWYNRNHGNTGLHATHHVYPLAHWSTYPALTVDLLEQARREGYDHEVVILDVDLPSVPLVIAYAILGPEGMLARYRIGTEAAIERLRAWDVPAPGTAFRRAA